MTSIHWFNWNIFTFLGHRYRLETSLKYQLSSVFLNYEGKRQVFIIKLTIFRFINFKQPNLLGLVLPKIGYLCQNYSLLNNCTLGKLFLYKTLQFFLMSTLPLLPLGLADFSLHRTQKWLKILKASFAYCKWTLMKLWSILYWLNYHT